MARSIRTRKMRLTLEIVVRGLTSDERYEASTIECVPERSIPRLRDVEAKELGYLIADGLPSLVGLQLFEGSGIYAKFKDARVLSCRFVKA